MPPSAPSLFDADEKTIDVPDASQAGPQERLPYVAIAGNIGSGKSSLSRLLGEAFGWDVFYERVDDNPYLEDFYDDMRRWSFNLQVFFLSSRFEQQRLIEEAGRPVVQDRSIYEDAEIFARNLHEMGLMDTRDFENYVALYHHMIRYLRAPTLLIYLRASVPTLVRHIQQRGRDYEATIRLDYLRRLEQHYERWVERYDLGPKMIIEVDELDFVHDETDYRVVVQRVQDRLFGLFPA